MFDREAFFGLSRTPAFEEVETPAGKVCVHALTAGERDALDVAIAKEPGVNFRAKLLHAACRTEAGGPIFDDEDIPRLGDVHCRFVEPLVEAAMRVNKMTDADIEAIRKN